MIDDWLPQKEDLDWTDNHFSAMSVGDTWSVSGALLEKSAEKELTLRQYPVESTMAIQRLMQVCDEIGVEFNSEGSQLIEDPMSAAQNAAKEWADPNSGIPLVNFDLANGRWDVHAVPSQDESGESIIVDQWTVCVTHPNDEEEGEVHEVMMTPMDYHLIAGDELFFSWKGMRVIEREEAIELANSREFLLQMLDGGVELLGDTYVHDEDGEWPVPPHMRGMLVTKLRNLNEEE